MKRRVDCSLGWTEERIVELLLSGVMAEEPQPDRQSPAGAQEDGALAETRRMLERHAGECQVCRERLREWSGLLAGRRAERPSPAIWRRLETALRWRAPLRQLVRLRLRISRTILAVGSTALLLGGLYVGALCGIKERLNAPSAASDAVRTDDEIMAHMGMLLQVRTAQYPVQSLGPSGAHGVALVNDEAEELLLLVEGLPNVPGQDYRVWSVHDGSRVALGTLQLAAGKAHLHYRGSELRGAKSISVSREQAGAGSAEARATAPEVAAVQLK
jgi:hypothetical protein